jgi:myosin heavy subunit
MMTYENFPSTDPATVSMPPAPKNNWRNILTGGLIVALLGTWGYIIWDKSQQKKIDEKKDQLVATTTTEKDELQKSLDDAAARFDMIKSSMADMEHRNDSTMTRRDKEIAEKKNRIQQLLAKGNATAAELSEAKRLISSLNEDITGFRTQIETLQNEKLVLTKEKETVTRQRNDVQRNYDSAKNVIKQKDESLDVGSTLNASNFSITGINEKRNGKEKSTTTARRVDKLRISFDLAENRIAQSGTKSLFICITAPDGTAVSVEALGSGKFTTREGEEKVFTQKLDINYTQGERQNVSFDWKQNSDFETGDYRIEVYQNGYKIGDGVRSFKKGGLFG